MLRKFEFGNFNLTLPIFRWHPNEIKQVTLPSVRQRSEGGASAQITQLRVSRTTFFPLFHHPFQQFSGMWQKLFLLLLTLHLFVHQTPVCMPSGLMKIQSSDIRWSKHLSFPCNRFRIYLPPSVHYSIIVNEFTML